MVELRARCYGGGKARKKIDLAALEQAGHCLDASIFQANRTQSLNYGCIVENPQTHEVRAKRELAGCLLCLSSFSHQSTSRECWNAMGWAPVLSNRWGTPSSMPLRKISEEVTVNFNGCGTPADVYTKGA